MMTASRKLSEESLNTFKILPSQIIENICNYVIYNNYVCFIKKLNINFATVKKIYILNRTKIYNTKNFVPHFWKETKNILLFPISLLTGYTTNECIYACNDTHGCLRMVSKRPIEYLKLAINYNIIYKKNYKWKTNLINNEIQINVNYYNNLLYLNETQSIVFKTNDNITKDNITNDNIIILIILN